jgi:hypothetical protein
MQTAMSFGRKEIFNLNRLDKKTEEKENKRRFR